jgi:hypothetical protein
VSYCRRTQAHWETVGSSRRWQSGSIMEPRAPNACRAFGLRTSIAWRKEEPGLETALGGGRGTKRWASVAEDHDQTSAVRASHWNQCRQFVWSGLGSECLLSRTRPPALAMARMERHSVRGRGARGISYDKLQSLMPSLRSSRRGQASSITPRRGLAGLTDVGELWWRIYPPLFIST